MGNVVEEAAAMGKESDKTMEEKRKEAAEKVEIVWCGGFFNYIEQYFFAVGVVLPVGEREKGKLTSSKKNKKWTTVLVKTFRMIDW